MIIDLIKVVIIFIFGFVLYYYYKTRYWTTKGLQTLPPIFPFGNTKDLILGLKTIGELLEDISKTAKTKGHKHVGIYFGTKPFYVPVDPEHVKYILQTDFQHFINHANYIEEEDDPLRAHLLLLKDEKWRMMRKKLTPVFTSGSLKMMFHTIADCAKSLKELFADASTTHTSIEIKDVMARFTTDVISSVAFGLECNSLKNPEVPFRKYGKKIFQIGRLEGLKILIQFVVPHYILRFFKYKLTKPDVEEFFMNTVKKTVDYREMNNIYRKDVMHLLIQLKNRGLVTNDSKLIDQEKPKEEALTLKQLAAQAYFFFAVGFDPASTTLTFALYEIANDPSVQEKLRNEIQTIMSLNKNELTYEAIIKMTYMEQVIFETLRKYPPLPFLTRKCTKDYVIPNTSIVVEKGVDVGISISALHSDPEYFPNPDKFDPERFSENAKQSIAPFTWIPFSEGPRICIGMRFGMLQIKIGLTTILSKYRVKLSKKNSFPLQMERNTFLTVPDGGIWLDVEKLEN